MNRKPVIALTAGDPAGIGPELCVRMLAARDIAKRCDLVVIGSHEVLCRAASTIGVPLPEAAVFSAAQLGRVVVEGPAVGDIPFGVDAFVPGAFSAACGQQAFLCIEAAIRAACAGTVAAVVTAPVCKKSLNMAGHKYAGHTEIFAEKTGTSRYCMMLTSDVMTVSFVTTHVGYAAAAEQITKARVAEVIELTASAVGRMKKGPVRLGVCALNPHAGEEGLFGNEEAESILPGIEMARLKGLDVTGPLPPDAAFTDKLRESFDALVCQYHDQGHIPFKMLAFDRGVNVTLGLPIVRTSVDHGTAFDIAWQGVASAESLRQAIFMALALQPE